VIGHSIVNPVTCVVDVSNNKLVLYNVYSLTTGQLRIFYYARMATSQSGYDVTIKGFANPHAYTNYQWPIFASSTSQSWTLNTMWYARRDWTGAHTNDASENSYSQM
jgi:hypothetical protein